MDMKTDRARFIPLMKYILIMQKVFWEYRFIFATWTSQLTFLNIVINAGLLLNSPNARKLFEEISTVIKLNIIIL